MTKEEYAYYREKYGRELDVEEYTALDMALHPADYGLYDVEVMNGYGYYRVTVTRDIRIWPDENEFRKAVDKCLSNLRYRRKWKTKSFWHRSDINGRLHLHALVQVPEGQMVGSLYSCRVFQEGFWVEMQFNTFFEEKFGRTEFRDLHDFPL